MAYESGGPMNDSIKIRCALTSIDELKKDIQRTLEDNGKGGFSPGDMAIRLGTLEGWLRVTEMRLEGIRNQLLYKPVNPEDL